MKGNVLSPERSVDSWGKGRWKLEKISELSSGNCLFLKPAFPFFQTLAGFSRKYNSNIFSGRLVAVVNSKLKEGEFTATRWTPRSFSNKCYERSHSRSSQTFITRKTVTTRKMKD